jgi:hypothetical protein
MEGIKNARKNAIKTNKYFVDIRKLVNNFPQFRKGTNDNKLHHAAPIEINNNLFLVYMNITVIDDMRIEIRKSNRQIDMNSYVNGCHFEGMHMSYTFGAYRGKVKGYPLDIVTFQVNNNYRSIFLQYLGF